MTGTVRIEHLLGREHQEIGVIEARTDGAVAVAISIGGAKKAYAHTDPNEDCALFAAGEGGVCVAVADGHGGVEAAEIVTTQLRETWAPRWTAAHPPLRGAWQEVALGALTQANAAILSQGARGGRRLSRTTLAFAVVRPAEGFVYYASIGDSHVYQVTGGAAYDLACELSSTGDPFFLGAGEETPESLRAKCVIGAERLQAAQAVLVVTDGLSERLVGVDDPDVTVAEVVARAADAPPAERALGTAYGLLEAALAAHTRNPSGDNVAAAVAWLEHPGATSS